MEFDHYDEAPSSVRDKLVADNLAAKEAD